MQQLVNQYGQPLHSAESRFVPISTRADGRATYDDYYLNPISTGFAYISPDNENDWKLKSIDESQLSTRTAQELVDIFLNSSPDLDRALHDMYQFCNIGWTLECDDPVGQRVLDNALKQMEELGQDLDDKINSLIASGFLWGALYSESIFDLDGTTFIDIAIISPSQARFQRRDVQPRGQYWQLGQEQRGRFVALTDPTIIYKNVNPVPDKPFGRPMVNSSLFGIIFVLGLLKSLRQVIETQAWPRQLWKIDREILHNANVNPKDIDKIVQETETKVEKYMSNANLDKAKQPIVGSEVLNEQIGGVNRSNFGAVESIQKLLDTWVTRGLKQYPILFGINSNSGLSDNSDIQLEAHTIFIESFQSGIEDMLNRQFQLILNAAGYPNLYPKFKLERVNSLVRHRRAETLEYEVNSVSRLIADRVINRQEGRLLLKSFSKQLDDLPDELPVLMDMTEITQMVTLGIISPQEGRDLLREYNEEFSILSVQAPEPEPEAPTGGGE